MILRQGETCWRTARAKRAAVLIDGAAYFAALRAALLKARRSILIVGWDVDSRTRLRPWPDTGLEGTPQTLRPLLVHIAERRPDVSIWVLPWDYSILYAPEREALTSLTLTWSVPTQIEVVPDDAVPLGGAHHQKIVVVDDAVAFCGGLDLTVRRWDTPEHRPNDPRRVDPGGRQYGSYHDIQMAVDGAAARALAELVRERWSYAGRTDLPPVAPYGDPWPDGIAPDFTDVDIGIARTLPAFDGRPEVQEVEALFVRSVAAAERRLYIENQYLTADRIAEALCRRMRERPELEVAIVGPKLPHGWLEARSMGAGRVRFMRQLQEAGVTDRIRLVYPLAEAGGMSAPVMVHAKFMAVDERLLRVGSANLNNRSMGLDTECDLAIEAANSQQARKIAEIRDRLLAEHLGIEPADVAAALADHGSLLRVVDDLGSATRYLAPVTDQEAYEDEFSQAVRDIADRELPLAPEDILGDMLGAEQAEQAIGRAAKLALVAGGLLAAVLLWRATPLADLADPQRLMPWFDAVAQAAWGPLLVLAVYVGAGLIGFPVTVLIALTAMAFGPWEGFLYAAVGSFFSAAAGYATGTWLGRKLLRDLMGERLNRINRAAARAGVVSVLAMRVVPAAPFTVVNLVCGASHIRFRDYIVGTVIGMAPGIAVMTALGDQLRGIAEDPNMANIGRFAVVLAIWLGVSLALQRLFSRLSRSRTE